MIIPDAVCTYVADDKEPWKYVYVSFSGADSDALARSAGLDSENFTFDFPLSDDMISDIYARHAACKKTRRRDMT